MFFMNTARRFRIYYYEDERIPSNMPGVKIPWETKGRRLSHTRSIVCFAELYCPSAEEDCMT